MTFRQYQALVTRWQEDQARQDRRAQQAVWMLAEIHRDRKQRPEPFSLTDFALHHWSLVDDGGRPPLRDDEHAAWEQINALRTAVFMTFGGEGKAHDDA